MNVTDQTPLTVYLMVFFGVAAVSTAAAIGAMAAAVRIWSSRRRRRHAELRRVRVGHGAGPDSGVAGVPDEASAGMSPNRP